MSDVIVKRRRNIGEAKDLENAMAKAEYTKAVQDYNIMMGNLEAPEEAEEEGEE